MTLMNWQLLLLALGLLMILEGLPYFLFPERVVDVLRTLEELGPAALRVIGLGVMLGGTALLVVVRWYGG